ncbi:MAG TPA: CobD/CbiB family protein [Burkholderiaceae bacterium]|nr:CobD/CbiB family protein [Burkholderiaceae bacterium]
MSWIALVITLLIEQVRPLPLRNPVYAAVSSLAGDAERNMNAGRRRHGMYAWLLIVGGATVLVGAMHAALLALFWLAALALNVLILYFTLGFRQFSHHFTLIQAALDGGDLAAAQHALTEWKQAGDRTYNAAGLEASEVVRQAIEHALLLSLRHVFGVLFWFVLLPGPMGAVMYRLADYLARRWSRTRSDGTPPDHFGEFAKQAFAWIDWLPARLTALGFAIVGDFEGTLFCWRQVTRAPAVDGMPSPDTRTLVLAAASGALGTRVMGISETAKYFDETSQDVANLAEPSVNTLHSVVGLAWRALLLWLGLLLLLTLAAWFS